MGRGARWAAVHGVAKSQTWLRDFTFSFHFHAVEKEMATHSSTLAWRIPWMEKPGILPMDGGVHGVAQSQTRLSDFTFTFHFSLSWIEKGNGNPLQCSCLENPRDWGAWWAAVYVVTQSWTWLKRLSSSTTNMTEKACNQSSIYSLAWAGASPESFL